MGLIPLACNNSPFVETPQPTATLIPTPTITPTLAPTLIVDEISGLEEADRALFQGDWDLALGLYRDAQLAANDLEGTASALLGEGKTLVRAGRWAEAVQSLNAYVQRFSDQQGIGSAYFLLGQAYEAQGLYSLAIESFRQSIPSGLGAVEAHVQERVGDLLRQDGRPLEAVEAYQIAFDAPGSRSVISTRLAMSEAYLEAGQAQQALAVADEVYQLTTDPSSKATANLIAGLALESLGEEQAAHARYLDSVDKFPEAYDSYTGLIRLVEAGVPVDEFQRGYVDFNAGAYTPAIGAFDRYLTINWDARGLYYRGLTYRALGEPGAAAVDFELVVTQFPGDPLWAAASLDLAYTQWAYLDQYSQAIQTYLTFVSTVPEHVSAPDALFAAGRTAERITDLSYAAEIWLRLPVEYPSHPLGYQGAFEAGIVHYRLAEFIAAIEDFEIALASASTPSQRAASLLWKGKALSTLGEDEQASLQWQAAAEADPTGYYSVRAADMLAGVRPFEAVGLFDFSTDPQEERRAAEIWLRSTFVIQGSEPLNQLSASLAQDLRLQRGEAYVELGLYTEAIQEFDALRELVSQDPEANYRLMHFFLTRGMYRQAILSARQILHLAGMDDAETMFAPVYFNHIRFGPYHGELILPAAVEYGFEGLLLLSVVRQESLFESAATSYAAARGLMQVIPSTGQSIAERLGWPPDYSSEDLYRPVVSVQFGSYYLGAQRDRFEGDLYAALAAYNAGPGNAILWKELAPDDPDLFLEVIRLNQPHQYIRTIYEVYAIYRNLYVFP